MPKPRQNRPPGFLFAKSELHKFRMEFSIELDGPVNALKAKELARRVCDRLRLELVDDGSMPEVVVAKMTCRELGRTLRIDRDQEH